MLLVRSIVDTAIQVPPSHFLPHSLQGICAHTWQEACEHSFGDPPLFKSIERYLSQNLCRIRRLIAIALAPVGERFYFDD
jgi:hypothetical protein